MDKPITIGAHVPTFALLAAKSGAITSASLGEGAYALIFYPGDDTPTCTNELLDFSNFSESFKKCHVRLIGVSRDSLASHVKFAAKHALKMELATDVDGRAVEAFGAWGEKQLFGRRYLGILRSTILVAGGRVRGLWRVKRVAGHAAEVLKAAQALGVD